MYSMPGGAVSSCFESLAGLNSPWDETDPSLTSDGLEFFFTSNRPGSLGGNSLWQSTRASVNDAWGSPVPVASIDSANHEQSPSLTDDGLWLFFASNRSGNFDLYAASRSSRQAPCGAPVRVAELSGPYHDIGIELWNIGASGQDGIAVVTTMVNGRAVLLRAPRDTTPGGPASGLSASTTVAPGELLSVHLRSPAGYLGMVMLGMPITPVQTPFDLLSIDPASIVTLDLFLQDQSQVRLVQTVLPANSQQSGLPFVLQALSSELPALQLTNAVLRTVQ